MDNKNIYTLAQYSSHEWIITALLIATVDKCSKQQMYLSFINFTEFYVILKMCKLQK